MSTRDYTTRRSQIVNALVTKLRTINGLGDFLTDLGNNVSPRLLFWDEVDSFPAVHLNAGSETREYRTSAQKDRFLNITLRCYIKDANNSTEALARLLEDVETVVEDNARLPYVDARNVTQYTQQITVISIDTDEGVLDPLGVGEMIIDVQY